MTIPPLNVSLREITPANRAALEALAAAAALAEYVTGVAESLVEAAETPDARPWYRAVHLEDEPVGFVMISDGIRVADPDYLGPYFLWRLLIDQRFQGRGLGSAALSLVVRHVRTRIDARVLLTSVGQGPDSPLGFYLRQGFQATGQVHQGELVLELDLLTPGSSSCAAAAACVRLGLCAGDVTVVMPGGSLQIGVAGDFSLTMLGPVEKVAEGTLAAELLGEAG
jgi:diamine N-acetyltransferase